MRGARGLRRPYLRWNRDLVAAVVELVGRYGSKRTAGMLGMTVGGLGDGLARHGLSLRGLKAPRHG